MEGRQYTSYSGWTELTRTALRVLKLASFVVHKVIMLLLPIPYYPQSFAKNWMTFAKRDSTYPSRVTLRYGTVLLFEGTHCVHVRSQRAPEGFCVSHASFAEPGVQEAVKRGWRHTVLYVIGQISPKGNASVLDLCCANQDYRWRCGWINLSNPYIKIVRFDWFWVDVTIAR